MMMLLLMMILIMMCDDDVDINRAWEAVKKNAKVQARESMGYYELNQYKSWFNEVCCAENRSIKSSLNLNCCRNQGK
jgi:hypothetical protein